ncbi:MAG: hypothetical protein KatS3mg124_2161 [Porticoccaceae bacterium]|nr:MAG: hypothetical protein KatS3mg124_2161 [Porticoccaceae bacterium]
MGAAAEEVVPDQTVEVEGGGGAHVDLVVGHLRFVADGGGDFPRRPGGALQRAALRHVEDDLELALVVEGQHLHLHPPERHGGHGEEQQHGDPRQEGVSPARVGDQRPHETAVQAGEQVLGMFGVRPGGRSGGRTLGQVPVFAAPAQDPDAGPWGDDEGDQQRPEHGRAGTDGDGPHVGAHEPADERHRQHGGDHGEGGQDRGIAHLAHGLHGDLAPGPAAVPGQVEVAHDVFHHDDGVVHQDADAEDQREQGDPVQRESR